MLSDQTFLKQSNLEVPICYLIEVHMLKIVKLKKKCMVNRYISLGKQITFYVLKRNNSCKSNEVTCVPNRISFYVQNRIYCQNKIRRTVKYKCNKKY